MQPSYRWNGEAESSWGRVFWKPRVPTSSTTRSEPLSCRCSCKTKEHQQQHRKKQIKHTQREKSWVIRSDPNPVDLSKCFIQSGLCPKTTLIKDFTAVINAVWISISDPIEIQSNPDPILNCRTRLDRDPEAGSCSTLILSVQLWCFYKIINKPNRPTLISKNHHLVWKIIMV